MKQPLWIYYPTNYRGWSYMTEAEALSTIKRRRMILLGGETYITQDKTLMIFKEEKHNEDKKRR